MKDDERGYDLIFVDADKEGYFGYWLESLRLVRKGGVVVVDNAIRGGEWVPFNALTFIGHSGPSCETSYLVTYRH